ncbi:hypothetical protein DACRYDRAFT_51943, partial [Dacryopinax primogenitus]
LALGYNIGCDFLKTVSCSCIAEASWDLNLHFYVGMLHGYVHNQKCQLHFDPCILSTAGLEDFKTNEWIFSWQNGTAHLFWYGSKFHCHMSLHLFWE